MKIFVRNEKWYCNCCGETIYKWKRYCDKCAKLGRLKQGKVEYKNRIKNGTMPKEYPMTEEVNKFKELIAIKKDFSYHKCSYCDLARQGYLILKVSISRSVSIYFCNDECKERYKAEQYWANLNKAGGKNGIETQKS